MIKSPKSNRCWFFVDESGDPTFYDRLGNLIVGKAGCSPVLLLGFAEMEDPHSVRRALLQLQQDIVGDPYFQGVPSLQKTMVAFHAKDDLPEIRYRVFKLMETLDFKAQIVVARKIEKVFRNNFDANEHQFYDHLVSQLFKVYCIDTMSITSTSPSGGTGIGRHLWPQPYSKASSSLRRHGILKSRHRSMFNPRVLKGNPA